MSEVFAWPEGELHLWSGSHTASGNPLAYVTNVNFAPAYQWLSEPSLSGTYRQTLQGQLATFNFTVGYLLGTTLPTLLDATGIVHVKFTHNNGLGSAGWIGYSGRMNSVGLNEFEPSPPQLTVDGFCHTWSAF